MGMIGLCVCGRGQVERSHTSRSTTGSERFMKTYLDTESVLGQYEDRHSHAIGDDNTRFTCIHQEI